MSRSKNNGKNRYKRTKVKADSPREQVLLSLKRTFGSTEKILRRNGKLWNRLINKERRSTGKKEIKDGLKGNEP